jgi:hypothetical protein
MLVRGAPKKRVIGWLCWVSWRRVKRVWGHRRRMGMQAVGILHEMTNINIREVRVARRMAVARCLGRSIFSTCILGCRCRSVGCEKRKEVLFVTMFMISIGVWEFCGNIVVGIGVRDWEIP